MSEASLQAEPAKVDPETRVLRGSPARAVRFKRRAIIGIAALGSVAIVAVAWMGISPLTFRIVARADKVEMAAPPDELTNAPKAYDDVPVLGPPLPGDLGRPILAHERAAMATEDGPRDLGRGGRAPASRCRSQNCPGIGRVDAEFG